MSDIAIRVDHVSKEYRLGMIGGTTLKADLQRLGAKIFRKEDPTAKIGTDASRIGERFLALDDVSFEVKKGEALGIIGHNGAGKSTLLKLLARVTAPTKGTISYNGRIASMLEVGTGFHGELTGRENIYMNGAILGMRKAEIDRKLDEIVAFAEMEKFIDTPVKRYSSGMYVKLAFAVAAHLDAEIMIMDEVLAVGDINFQQKCLKKMRDIANFGGRTILYVSHNMSTINQLCDRCLVLKSGRLLFDGNTARSIELYSEVRETLDDKLVYSTGALTRIPGCVLKSRITEVKIQQKIINNGENLSFTLKIDSTHSDKKHIIRAILYKQDGSPLGIAYSFPFFLNQGENIVELKFYAGLLSAGKYALDLILCEIANDMQIRHDVLQRIIEFEVVNEKVLYGVTWYKNSWGNVFFQRLETLVYQNSNCIG